MLAQNQGHGCGTIAPYHFRDPCVLTLTYTVPSMDSDTSHLAQSLSTVPSPILAPDSPNTMDSETRTWDATGHHQPSDQPKSVDTLVNTLLGYSGISVPSPSSLGQHLLP